jgi:hypothetical protein
MTVQKRRDDGFLKGLDMLSSSSNGNENDGHGKLIPPKN